MGLVAEILNRLSKIEDNVVSNEYCRCPKYIEPDFADVKNLLTELDILIKAKGGKDGIQGT